MNALDMLNEVTLRLWVHGQVTLALHPHLGVLAQAVHGAPLGTPTTGGAGGVTNPIDQPLNILSAITAALGAGGVLYNLLHMGRHGMALGHTKNMGEALGGVARSGMGLLICLFVLGGGAISWLQTQGASPLIPVPGH